MFSAGFPDNFFYFKDIDDNFPGTLELSVTETLIILSSKFGISIKVAPVLPRAATEPFLN